MCEWASRGSLQVMWESEVASARTGRQLALSAAGLTVIAAAALPVLELYQVVGDYHSQLLPQGNWPAQVGKEATLRLFALAHSSSIMAYSSQLLHNLLRGAAVIISECCRCSCPLSGTMEGQNPQI